jgi:hypothetical protein
MAEQQLRPLLPPKVLKSLASFFDQAYRQLRTEQSGQRDREWLTKVRVVSTTQPLLPPKINDSTFEQVCSALYGDLWLDVAYLNAAGERVQGRDMPLGMVQQGPRMYLVCRFHGFMNERHLALHRITSAHATSFNFKRPVGFDLKKYDEEGRFGFGQGKLIRLTFPIEKDAGRHLLESPLSKDQHVSELRKHFEVTATVHDSLILDWWLRGFGKAVTRISKAEHIHR